MAAQQSWTSWLLGGWAGTEHSVNADPSRNQGDLKDAPQKASQPGGPPASDLPYGPYVRTGRGGAGNFTWESEQQPSRSTNDVEAQSPSTLSEKRDAAAIAEHQDTGAAVKSQAAQRPASQYIRVGRGYVQSTEVQTSPRLASLSAQSPVSPVAPNPPVAHPGRGGAGNRAAAAELNERVLREKLEKERLDAERRREKIAEEVQSSLQMPAGAWLGDKGRNIDPGNA